jgi:acyl dehydratase
MMKFLMSAAIASGLVGLTSVAEARSFYDGSWDLRFVTQRGTCDPSYDFTVNINDGIVTHPNLVRFKGYVAPSGAVRASVTVQDKYASGSGKLSNNTGRGIWRGFSGTTRCSGYWTAQRN